MIISPHPVKVLIYLLMRLKIKEQERKKERKSFAKMEGNIPAHGGPLKVRACPLGACVAGTMLGERAPPK